MNREDWFNLELGTYLLDDRYGYKYELTVSLTESNSRCYSLSEQGRCLHSIFFIETMAVEEYDTEPCKVLGALCGVGGVRIHSIDTFSTLEPLRLLEKIK